jgi:hypothetical protein
MVVDMFERTSYREQDPLASLLSDSGHVKAAQQIELHRHINESGKHENEGMNFLVHMGPVDGRYAIEALHLAEWTTTLLHMISATLLREISV